jgi:hypothetical protein
MRETEKFRSDLLRAAGRDSGDSASIENLRSLFYRSFPAIGEETKAALFSAYLDRRRESPEAALEWLSGAGSVLAMDYDGTRFTQDDWREIREAVCLEEETMDIDLLEYVMSLVVDHGAL